MTLVRRIAEKLALVRTVVEPLPIEHTRYRPKGSPARIGEEDTVILHLDGRPWDKVPAPPWRHVCWPQTEAWDSAAFHLTQRCACGGRRESPYAPWHERNSLG